MSRRTIWKFSLDVLDRQSIWVPRGYEPLDVQVQDGTIVLWARVDADQPMVHQGILVCGTGNPVPDSTGRYIGTVQHDLGLVWHVFEELS